MGCSAALPVSAQMSVRAEASLSRRPSPDEGSTFRRGRGSVADRRECGRGMCSRMLDHGVEFIAEPRDAPYGRVAVFLDLSGNEWDLLRPPRS
jgi:uncharacterized glyoxalase superfamily protein PhnB